MPSAEPSPNLYSIPTAARLGIAFFLVTLCGIGYLAQIEPVWARWVIVITSVIAVVFAYSPMKGVGDGSDRDSSYRRLRALRIERKQLEKKRSQVERIRIAYAERQDFPELARLRSHPWQVLTHRERDSQVRTLLEREMDDLIVKFSSDGYSKDGEIDTRLLFTDLLVFSESIARIYHPDAKQPLLELDLESLLKAVNRATVQILLLMETLPVPRPLARVMDLRTMSLRTMADWFRRAAAAYKTWAQVERYFGSFFWYLWHGSKFLLIAWNPFAIIAYVVGAETTTSLLSKFGRNVISAHHLSLMREILGIVAWETASIYDPKHRYRNPDWIYGVELVNLISLVEESPQILREALKDLSSLSIRSSFDRVFLYRCVALNRSPKLATAEDTSILPEELRTEIRDELLTFYRKYFVESTFLQPSVFRKWSKELHHRLGLEFSPDQEQADRLAPVEDKDPSNRFPQKFRRYLQKKLTRRPK